MRFRQGDIVDVERILITDVDDEPKIIELSEGAAVVTQTCDLVRLNPPTAEIAAVVRLPADRAGSARKGHEPRYIHLNRIGDDAFADLAFKTTLSKARLISLSRRPGLIEDTDDSPRTFRRAVGRAYSRFPFPDEFVPWLRPLQVLMKKKSGHPESALGKMLDEYVRELRIQCLNKWSAGQPYYLVLIIVLKIGVLPTVDDDAVDQVELALHYSANSPAQIADELLKESNSDRRVALWHAFGDSLARLCKPPSTSGPEVAHAVADITAEVVREDELTYDRVLRSEEVDLAHLSEPVDL